MTDSFESDSSRRSYSSDSRYSASSRKSPVRQPTSPNRAEPSRANDGVPHSGSGSFSQSTRPQHHERQHDVTGPYPIQVPPDQVPPSYDRPPPRQPITHFSDDEEIRQPSRGGRRQAPPDGSVVRIMRPEDFKALFHGTIIQEQPQRINHDTSLTPRGGRGDRSFTLSNNASRAPAAPALGQARPASRQKQRDFIDPYKGTTFRHKIVVPKEGDSRPQARDDSRGNKRRAASRLRAQVHEAQAISNNSVVPPKTASYKELGAYQELQEVKKAMLRKDKEIDGMRKDLRSLEEKNIRLENAAIKGKSADAAAALQTTMDNLRAKVQSQARRIQELEDEQYDMKKRSRACRVGELEHQCAAYISENRRLAGILSEMNEITKKGGEAALLQEAQTMLRHKDAAIESANEKLRVCRDEQRRAEAEAHTWRTRWDTDHRETEEVRKRLEELRDAPGEILRLRRQIEGLNNDKLENVHREERSKAGEAYENTHAKQHLEAMTRERDLLISQLQEKDRVIDSHRTESVKRTAALEKEMQDRLSVQLVEERRQFQDREFQLKQLIGDWEKRFKALEEQNVRLQDKMKRGQEHQQIKEHQMQENLLATMGKFENDRMADLQRDMADRERRLKSQQDALTAERARWEAERAQSEHDHLRRSTTTAAAASHAQPAAPLYPVPSTLGPMHTRDGSISNGTGGGSDTGLSVNKSTMPQTPPVQVPPVALASALAGQPQPSRNDSMTPTTAQQPHQPRVPPTASSMTGPQLSQAGPSKPATRYDRGEEAPSEVTVRHGQDEGDMSSVASSILSESPASALQERMKSGPSLQRSSSSSPPAPAAPLQLATQPGGIVPKPIAPASPTVRPTQPTTPQSQPRVPLVVPVPNPGAASAPPSISSQPPLTAAPSPLVVAVPQPTPSPPPPVVVAPPVASAPQVVVPVPVAPKPQPTAPGSTPPPPAVSVQPVLGVGSATSPKVPTPAAVAVGVAMSNPTPIPVPKPLTGGAQAPPPLAVGPTPVPVPTGAPTPVVAPVPPKPAVGAVAPTKKKGPVKSNDTDEDDSDSDEEFVINEGPRGPGDEDDF